MRLEEVVDVIRVPTEGDLGACVLEVPRRAPDTRHECEVLVAGGGVGGVAAALAAVRRGRTVCLTEETDWLGGQMTAQGVAALDEHDEIERFGGTRSYSALRRSIREHYGESNPGLCWVSRLAFEPGVAVEAIARLLEPAVADGRLRVLLRCKPVDALVEDGRVSNVTFMDLERLSLIAVHAQIVVDATELGDLLPLTGAPYVAGAEARDETNELHARGDRPRPALSQSFTYTFAVERMPLGEDHRIARPTGYERYLSDQPYSLTIDVHGGEIYGESTGRLTYRLFETMPGTKGSLWTYRRLLAAECPGAGVARDVTMINWPGNDYRDGGLIDVPARAVAGALQEAKRVSLGFLYWLQTAAPTTAERLGAPELRLRGDVMDTADGLAKYPYIRESRRIRAIRTVLEEDVSAEGRDGPRAAHFHDAAGVGWYPIDIHAAKGDDHGVSLRTLPFQIPLGALIDANVGNLLAGAKNLGTTHITNGCYRLHPVEWNTGESAGLLADWSIDRHVSPAAIWHDPELLRGFQSLLLSEGVPLAWIVDVGVEHEAFAAAQTLFMEQPSVAARELLFHPEAPMSDDLWHAWGGDGPAPPTRGAAAIRLMCR